MKRNSEDITILFVQGLKLPPNPNLELSDHWADKKLVDIECREMV